MNPVTLATLRKILGALVVALVALLVLVVGGNKAPTLTSIATLSGGREDTPLAIPYATLAAAANEADADSANLSFLITSVSSGTLTMRGTAVVAGTTRCTSTDTLSWTPALNANGSAVPAFAVKAHDGFLTSSTAVPVNVAVKAVNDAPTLTAITTLEGGQEDTPFEIPYTLLASSADEADAESSTCLS